MKRLNLIENEYARSYHRRAWHKFEDGDLRGALADYDMAIAIEPRNQTLLAGRALVHNEMGNYSLELADHNLIVAINGFDFVLFMRAQCHQIMGNYQLAIADLERAEFLSDIELLKSTIVRMRMSLIAQCGLVQLVD
jgi:tetratricopeptide (TPR) repeat protein